MGCHPSKLKRPSVMRISGKQNNDQLEENSKDLNAFGNVVSDSTILLNQDQKTISDIRKDLNETPELFVLNNVLMCTHFLGNYQKDMAEIHHQINIREERFLEPDIVMEQANRNITYRPLHGPNKEYPVPLVTKRIYVPVNNVIDVRRRDHTDKTENCGNKFQVQMEKSKRRGFVKLRRCIESCNDDRNSLKDTLPVPFSSTSGSSDTDSAESTSTWTGPIEKSQFIKDQADAGSLHDCFVFRKVKKPDADVNLEDMDHKNLTDDDVYDIVSYLPSRNFMKYFQSKIFRNSIAKELGLIQYEIDNSIVDEKIPGKIFCNLRDDDGHTTPVEVLPCLKIPWPEDATLNFLFRNPAEIAKDDFVWPTNEMLREIGRLDCVLVPKGYHKKRGVYPEGDLEWEIHFPLAERYLESFLRPEQIKCYLVLLTLHKEYIEPITRKQGIMPEHFRTLLFWESEIDYDSWPEHRLGIRLMGIIRKMKIALHRGSLPDYFMGKYKNVFRKIPKQYLLHANEVFHKITQSPVTFIVRALRNLRTTTGTFYPPLNYKELLDILYKKNWDNSSHLLNNINIVDDAVSVASSSLDKKPRFSNAETQLQYVKERERKRRLMKKREKLNNDKNAGNLKYSVGVKERRGSEDSIDDNWECEKRFSVEKKIALLKFFINNYIDIAKASYRISTNKQALFYLKQAWYLTKILEEENKLFAEEVKDFFAKISAEENKCKDAWQMDVLNDGHIDEINNNVKISVEISEEQSKNLNKMMSIFSAISRREEYCDSVVVHQQGSHLNGISRSISRSFSNNYPSVLESDNDNAEFR